MDRSERRRIAEALILGSPDPIPAARIADIIPYGKPAEARQFVDELNTEYVKQGRAFEITEVAGGFQLRSLPEFAPYLQQTLKARPLRLSQAALETLAVVAYRQPVTRAEVEHIRGVDAGPVMRTLVERKLVRIAGHRDVPGRPMVYATSKRFLEVFELPNLEALPTLRDLQELAPEGALAIEADEEGSDAPVTESVREASDGAPAEGDASEAELSPDPALPSDVSQSAAPIPE